MLNGHVNVVEATDFDPFPISFLAPRESIDQRFELPLAQFDLEVPHTVDEVVNKNLLGIVWVGL